MFYNRSRYRKKIVLFLAIVLSFTVVLTGRLSYLMIFCSEEYEAAAQELHEREREIKAPRGEIRDANGVVIATNQTVCTISVIYSQITNPEFVIEVLCKELELSEEKVRKAVEKVSVREKIASNVSKEVGDRIRNYNLSGVKVDEDYKRYYPYQSLASKVLGFTGADNQGIIGLEVQYESYLKGINGKILTMADAKGVELDGMAENRKEPVSGKHLNVSLDINIQTYAAQAAKKALESKQANYVSIIVMNPNNGEILAMVNEPEFDLNTPFVLNIEGAQLLSDEEYQKNLNQMWRNQCINDTYEPGSTFKIVTATAGLEAGVVTMNSHFSCPGFRIVEDRRIRCHKTIGHGSESFLQGLMNSCNPVFMDVGARVGPEQFFHYMKQLGLMTKTGVDLPGEAGTIIHKLENVGPVELATMSFGQSFQITPLQLLTAASAVINGGTLVTPHFGVSVSDEEGTVIETFQYPTQSGVIRSATSDTMKQMLEKVVSEGGGSRGIVEGYLVGGKTATSQKLPRSARKYIGSFIGFAPASAPQVIAICIIDEPQGIYYGGTIAAPVIQELYENILPYLKIAKTEYTEEEQ